jgi:hypothetical protein
VRARWRVEAGSGLCGSVASRVVGCGGFCGLLLGRVVVGKSLLFPAFRVLDVLWRLGLGIGLSRPEAGSKDIGLYVIAYGLAGFRAACARFVLGRPEACALVLLASRANVVGLLMLTGS